MANQLSAAHPAHNAEKDDIVVMIEAYDLCAKLPYHKHKLILLLSAMRHFRDELEQKGVTVKYERLARNTKFLARLKANIQVEKPDVIRFTTAPNRKQYLALVRLCESMNKKVHVDESDMFLTPISVFGDWYDGKKRPIMDSFYRMQRARLNVLMDGSKPQGGKWSFDDKNRMPLPKKGVTVPKLPTFQATDHVKDVSKSIDELFSDNPGNSNDFWLPITYDKAKKQLDTFLVERFELFGVYEDAMAHNQPFLFHSVLSPLLNCGLLTPRYVVDRALKLADEHNVPMNSLEGFIRQIIGWREYMHGMYRHETELESANFFGFMKELEDWWYDETYKDKGLPEPVKAALETVHSYGYNHHIERLMVLGNWFLLNEYNPQSVNRWFMSMYVDAYEWVMLPNVIGMSQYADGGVIATKPYISGGSYLQKMGRWWKDNEAAKQSDYTKKYWAFLSNQHHKLSNNPRMSLVLAQVRNK